MQNNEQATQVSPVGAQASAPEAEGRTSQPAETPEPNEFEAVKSRLEEIARAVDDGNLSLDDALDLYEEAVKLGLQASNLLEVGIVVEEEPAAEEAAGETVGTLTERPAGEAGAGNVPDNADAPTQP